MDMLISKRKIILILSIVLIVALSGGVFSSVYGAKKTKPVRAKTVYANSKRKAPTPVKGIKAITCYNGSTEVLWKKSKNTKKYAVKLYELKGNSRKLVESKNTDRNEVTLKNTTFSRKYEVKIRSINGKKSGKISGLIFSTAKKKKFPRVKADLDSIFFPLTYLAMDINSWNCNYIKIKIFDKRGKLINVITKKTKKRAFDEGGTQEDIWFVKELKTGKYKLKINAFKKNCKSKTIIKNIYIKARKGTKNLENKKNGVFKKKGQYLEYPCWGSRLIIGEKYSVKNIKFRLKAIKIDDSHLAELRGITSDNKSIVINFYKKSSGAESPRGIYVYDNKEIKSRYKFPVIYETVSAGYNGDNYDPEEDRFYGFLKLRNESDAGKYTVKLNLDEQMLDPEKYPYNKWTSVYRNLSKKHKVPAQSIRSAADCYYMIIYKNVNGKEVEIAREIGYGLDEED